MDHHGSAGDVVILILRRLCVELERSEAPLTRDEPDSVHQTRILVRRLRSVLKEYPGVLKARPARKLRRRLKRWGDELGVARDAEVQRALAEAATGMLPRAADVIVASLGAPASRAYRRGHDQLMRTLASAAHADLLLALNVYAREPPLGHSAGGAAETTLGPLLAGSVRKLVSAVPSRRAVSRIQAAGDSELDDLHELRKHARRVRYAAEEAVEAGAGLASARWLGRATDLAQAAKKLQDILGEHRDATLFAAHAEELAGSGLGSATRDALLRVAEDSRARAAEALEPLRRAAKRLAATAEAMR